VRRLQGVLVKSGIVVGIDVSGRMRVRYLRLQASKW
jgi:hypothetical protein